jgi:RNA polymerase sigma-70 factor (ECF subfamily)
LSVKGLFMNEGESSGTDDDLQRLREAGPGALAALYARYRERLRRMVDLRLDARLRSRLDASDILQEAFLDVTRDLPAYLDRPDIPPFLWMRIHVGRRLSLAHRRHLGTRARDAGLEIALNHQAIPGASSVGLALMLLGRDTSPSRAAQRAERVVLVQEALNGLEPIDREILALRHFEQLSRAEAAAALGIDPATGAKRYFRALTRLKAVLAMLPDGLEGL